MISAQQLEVRAGARLLMHDVSFRVGPGDKVGLVGRNGAGKTTLTRILAGEAQPASGQVTSTGSVGYLPQDPRTGDPEVPVRERILSARGLDSVVRRLRAAETEMGSDEPAVRERAMKRYERADADLHAGGGYAAEAEAAQIAASLGIEDRLMIQSLRTLSGGQRRRVELARILFSGAETLLLDEPTNHLDADSIVWLREFLRSHKGGLVVIVLLRACSGIDLTGGGTGATGGYDPGRFQGDSSAYDSCKTGQDANDHPATCGLVAVENSLVCLLYTSPSPRDS